MYMDALQRESARLMMHGKATGWTVITLPRALTTEPIRSAPTVALYLGPMVVMTALKQMGMPAGVSPYQRAMAVPLPLLAGFGTSYGLSRTVFSNRMFSE